jgi:Tol biopolymer transport system component/DNA-binding winged helix-turn-helix (wHTH) protein
MDADIRSHSRRCYTFGPFAADCRKRLLWRDGTVVPLTPKAFEILSTLIEHRGRVVDKDELLQEVWGNVAVEDATLARHISTLRRALDERPNQHLYVVTVPGRGYEFVATIDEIAEASMPATPPPPVESHATEPEGPPRKTAVGLAVLVAALTLAVAAATLYTVEFRRGQVRVPERGLRQFTFRGGLQRDAAWSPDGQWIAYTSDADGNSDIWVQKVSDSQAFPVSPSPFEDSQPDWSPDGKRIVFRSEREGGGLFVAPLGGGPERRIAGFGYHPKWSPTGSAVMFTSSGHLGGATRIYLVNVDAGVPDLFRPDLLADFSVVDAEWKPDGSAVSVWGRRRGSVVWTFLTVPLSGPAAVASRTATADRQIADERVSFERFAWSRSGRYLFFEGLSQQVRNLWRVTVDPSTQTWLAADRLTTGAGPDADVAVSPDGTRLIYSARSSRTRLWSYPFDAAASRIVGAGEPLTSGGASEQDPECPADGNKLVYSAIRGGRYEFWERTIADGRERLLLSATGWTLTRPRWSRDGLRLAYLRRRNDDAERADYAVMVLPVGGQERPLTQPGQVDLVPTDWSADGKWLLGSCRTGTPPRLAACMLPVSEGSVSPTELHVVAADPAKNIYESRFSPDQRWISFIAVDRADARVSRVYVVPASGGAWHALTEGRWYDDKPHWSPDSRTLYFLSDRNGLLNLWARHFDPDTGTVTGEAFQVTTFTSPRETISGELTHTQIALTSAHLFLPITESTAELWMLDNVHR